MDWLDDDVDLEDSDMDDDEEEIRQLDAALEQADIEVCENSETADWHISGPSVQIKNMPESLIVKPASTPTELTKIDSILAVNKLYDEKLQRLENILGFRLRECRIKLNELKENSASTDRQDVFRYVSCGKPYFRDRANFPAPDNEDTKVIKSQMYDFALVSSVPGWTVLDKNQFTNVMIKTSIKIKKDSLNEKLLDLKKSYVENPNKITKKEITKVSQELNRISTKLPFYELALPLNEEYDWDMLANKLNKRHTAHEYRCLWKLYLHPSINKSTWKNSEHNQLQTIAATFNHQNWDDIAKKLNTGRTGYQCFVYFRTNINSNFNGKKWTPEEITYLKRLVEYFREDCYIPWGKIAAAMEQRTKVQIYNKYLRIIEQRKGRFLPEEDSVILNCVEKYGINFRKINEYLPHRSAIQIRSRYHVLTKMRISTTWSVEDDKKLVQIMSNQDSGMNFSVATKFFPGRNRVTIRSRYVTLKRWMKKHPNLGIEHAPRRGARRLNHGQPSDDLNSAIENLKNTLNTEVAIKKDRKKITRDSEEHDIEDAIIATLVNETVRDKELQRNSLESSLVLPNATVVSNEKLDLTNLRKCLLFLGSNLNQKLYSESDYFKEYPNLGDSSQDVSLLTVKSYSRKKAVVTINVDKTPDIWGNNILSCREYVMPPHYATITGCKALMSHVTAYSMYCNYLNVSVLSKRNPALRKEIDLLLERFYILFLWPMLLSNEGPKDFFNSKLDKSDSYYVRPPSIPNAPEVTIRKSYLKKYRNEDVSEVIDLCEDNNKNKENSMIVLEQTNTYNDNNVD